MEVQRHDIRTRDGHRLDAELARPDDPTWGVVLVHPHPQFGGSMHNHVIDALFTAMPEYGATVMRFNFRGVGTSQGTFDDGNAERLDLLAAVETVSELLGRDAHGVIVAGYSFGADIALALDHLSIAGWWAVVPPLSVHPPDAYLAAHDERPKRVLIAENDEFNPPAQAQSKLAGWTNLEAATLPGVGHMLDNQGPALVKDLASFAERVRAPAPG
ncbi:MAG: alpha/beta hydrolase [Acidimicrobiales bacterium]